MYTLTQQQQQQQQQRLLDPSASALEAFIRAKYEQKKYIAKEWVPPKPVVPKEVSYRRWVSLGTFDVFSGICYLFVVCLLPDVLTDYMTD